MSTTTATKYRRCARWTEELRSAADHDGDARGVASVQSLDPEHLPEEIELTELLHHRFPDVSQVAWFDTAFLRDSLLTAKRIFTNTAKT